MAELFRSSGELVRAGGVCRLTVRLSLRQQPPVRAGTVTAWRHPGLSTGRLHIERPPNIRRGRRHRRPPALVVVGQAPEALASPGVPLFAVTVGPYPYPEQAGPLTRSAPHSVVWSVGQDGELAITVGERPELLVRTGGPLSLSDFADSTGSPGPSRFPPGAGRAPARDPAKEGRSAPETPIVGSDPWRHRTGPGFPGDFRGDALPIEDLDLTGVPPLPEPGPPVVSTGFAAPDAAAVPLDRRRPLRPRSRYLFWLVIGPPVEGSIDPDPQPLPAFVPAGARITVILWALDGGAEVVGPGNGVELELTAAGSIPRRVSIEVLTGDPGTATWRCSLYWRGTLVQERHVSALVAERGSMLAGAALSSAIEYQLADPAEVDEMDQLPSHQACLTLTQQSDATHVLTMHAVDGLEVLHERISLTEGDISAQITAARNALRRVAWGSAEPWDCNLGHGDRHAEPATLESLTRDLAGLATSGFRLYYDLTSELGQSSGRGSRAVRTQLRNALAAPGSVQLALTRSARHVLPAALIYDLPLDTARSEQAVLCPDFAAAFARGTAATAPCFESACAQAREQHLDVVCPGGFWGFRHQLGLPLPIPGHTPAPALRAEGEQLRLTAGIYQGFSTTPAHRTALRALVPDMDYRESSERVALLRLLGSEPAPHLVYFYCHGGLTAQRTPYLLIDSDVKQGAITPDNLLSYQVEWNDSRPLVFLNGCRTTDIQPEQLMSFATAFVTDAGASGVIGTEITVFEPMASRFAEDFLRLLLVDRLPAGEAVLTARRLLLAAGNPLGLAYIAFLLPNLTLEPTPQPAAP